MASTLGQLAWVIMRGVLPCPDLVRRLRVRRAAKALITCRSWPEDDETTGFHVAQLAMLRALWLQRETRRLTRWRHREAAVLMSRSALETFILGVYCLFAEDPVSGLKADSLRTGFAAAAALLDGMIPRELLKEAVNKLGDSGRPVGVRDMAKHIDGKLGGDGVSRLYDLVYAPTSNHFTHANAGSLIRHVRPDDKLSSKPSAPWVRRSPVRLADASVGILAVHLARYESVPDGLFARYAQTHLERILPPLASLLGKRMGKKTGLLPLVRLVIHVRQLQPAISRPDLSDRDRETLVRQLYQDLTSQLEGAPAEAVAPVIEYFVQTIIREYTAEARN
ncbi:hypothetical protein K1Y78_47880 [Streptomyces sp. tea 10]|nr:hypothetical protein [Streptomyces sp. tea 10]